MRLLLDTHVFLWYIGADSRLSAAFETAIKDSGNDVHLSVASIWEAVIKFQLGKLSLPSPPADYLSQQRVAHGIAPLSIDEETIPHLAALPPHHRDPFDRLLVAQALQHGLTLVTVDAQLSFYSVPLLPMK